MAGVLLPPESFITLPPPLPEHIRGEGGEKTLLTTWANWARSGEKCAGIAEGTEKRKDGKVEPNPQKSQAGPQFSSFCWLQLFLRTHLVLPTPEDACLDFKLRWGSGTPALDFAGCSSSGGYFTHHKIEKKKLFPLFMQISFVSLPNSLSSCCQMMLLQFGPLVCKGFAAWIFWLYNLRRCLCN